MPQISAGLLLYRSMGGKTEVFLVHPGGPLWAKKDLGAWSIPKGLPDPGEDLFEAAKREFLEETGCTAAGRFFLLSPVTLRSGKIVHSWAVEGACDPGSISSNMFSMEWPPRSGRRREFPEVDRAAWFDLEEAKKKINPGQAGLLTQLREVLRKNVRKTGG